MADILITASINYTTAIDVCLCSSYLMSHNALKQSSVLFILQRSVKPCVVCKTLITNVFI